MAVIDLSQLPPPTVVQAIDFETVLASLKTDLVTRDPDLGPVLALESEPLVKLLEVSAYRETVLRSDFNQRARANMLAYATGADLDNLAANLGGAIREPGESDADFLSRALLALDGEAVAGPRNAYVYHALSASPQVAGAAVSSPAPGQVRVAVLSTAADGVASASLLLLVAAALTPDDVRPLSDQVSVVSAAVALYDVAATLTVGQGADPALVQAAAAAAVGVYAASKRKLGATVTRAGLIAALVQSGVDNVALTSPAADVVGGPELAPVLHTFTTAVAQ